MTVPEGHYIGDELSIFKEAVYWKKYFCKFLSPYISGKVLEVGAGIGGTTKILCNGRCDKWICLEPDPELAEELTRTITRELQGIPCEVRRCLLKNLPSEESYDTILYIDVLEHIEDDREEVINAVTKLNVGGSIIVLGPAHQWLYSEFDRSIGHYRRYNKGSLLELTPANAKLIDFRYLDSVGMLASIANRLFLRQSLPNLKQIKFWDRRIIRLSRVMDPLLMYSIGKSAFAIWQRIS